MAVAVKLLPQRGRRRSLEVGLHALRALTRVFLLAFEVFALRELGFVKFLETSCVNDYAAQVGASQQALHPLTGPSPSSTLYRCAHC
jgi:hypothetical protein